MKHYALTGGIGSGKSTVLEMFKKRGVPTFSADDAAKYAMQNTEEIKAKIISLLGVKAYVDGQLNRPFIAEQVFDDKQKLEALNAIVHPVAKAAYAAWRKQQTAPYTMYEFPLVFELDAADSFDKVILVTAPEAVRIQRVQKRDNTTEEAVQARMSNQLTDAQKIPLADIVIENTTITKVQGQVDALHHELMALSEK